jgi:hypothetical protein
MSAARYQVPGNAVRRPDTADFFRSFAQADVERPQREGVQFGGGKNLEVAPAQTATIQPVTFDEGENVARGAFNCFEKAHQAGQGAIPLPEISSGKFAENDGVCDDASLPSSATISGKGSGSGRARRRCPPEQARSVPRRVTTLARREFQVGHRSAQFGKMALRFAAEGKGFERAADQLGAVVDLGGEFGLSENRFVNLYGDAHASKIHSGAGHVEAAVAAPLPLFRHAASVFWTRAL